MIAVEITTRCNLSCVYCPKRVDKLKEKDMTADEFHHILREILPYRHTPYNLELAMCGLGEPLMNPYLPAMLKDPFLRKFPKVLFPTNGTLLTPEMIDLLVKSSLWRLTVSLQSSRKDIMEYLQRGAKFKEVVENTRNLLSAARGRKLMVRVMHLVTPLTARETKADFEKLLGVKLEIARSEDSRKTNFILVRKKVRPGSLGRQMPEDYRCLVLPPPTVPTCEKIYGRNIVINVHGDLTGCCWDSTRLQTYGNIFEKPLAELRSGKLLKDLKKELARGDFHRLPVCKRCLGG